MKKTYIAPAMETEKIVAEELICLSLQGAADDSAVLGKERIPVEAQEETWGNLW